MFHLFFFTHTPPTEIYTLSLHDALPIYGRRATAFRIIIPQRNSNGIITIIISQFNHFTMYIFHFCNYIASLWSYSLDRSEEHTSELQSRGHLVCRLLLEKKQELIILSRL